MLRNRVIYIGTLIGVLYLAYRYQTQVTSMFGYTLLILPCLSIIHVLWIYKNFTYHQNINNKFIMKGETIDFTYIIANESKLIYPELMIVFYGQNNRMGNYFDPVTMSIGPKATQSYTYSIQCPYRGYYEVGIQKVVIKDFLGLIHLSYKLFNPMYVTVYPRVVKLSYFPIEDWNQEIEQSLLDIRKYAYGDNMRDIHWKLSAKKQTLLVKKYDALREVKTTILLDLSKQYYDQQTNILIEEQLIESTIAVLYYCLNLEIPVQFMYFSTNLMIYSGQRKEDFQRLYPLFLEMACEAQISFDEVLKLTHEVGIEPGSIIMITANLTYGLYQEVCSRILEHKKVSILYIATELENEEIASVQSIKDALMKLDISFFEIDITQNLEEVLKAYRGGSL